MENYRIERPTNYSPTNFLIKKGTRKINQTTSPVAWLCLGFVNYYIFGDIYLYTIKQRIDQILEIPNFKSLGICKFR